METLSWIINGLAVIGWLTNIKHRKQAMLVFTVATILSIVYFTTTAQTSFLLRSIFYLGIDVVTLWNIFTEEGKHKETNGGHDGRLST